MKNYQRISDVGFDYIELAGKRVVDADRQAFLSILRTLAKGRIPCLALNAYCPPGIVIAGPGYDSGSVKEYATVCAARAYELGVQTVSIGSPESRILPPDFPFGKAWEQIVEFLKITVAIFARYRIAACLEPLGPCYCNFINTVDEAIEVARQANGENGKIVLDYYNMEQSGEADIDLTFAKPYVWHVHISDDDGYPTRRNFLKDERKGLHMRRLERLAALGYDGPVSVEIDLPVDLDRAERTLDLLHAVNEHKLIR